MAPDDKLRQSLEDVSRSTDRLARLANDPVSIVREQNGAEQQEVVGLIASSLAFGNVATIRSKIRDALRRAGHDLIEAAHDPDALRSNLATWKHRVYKGDDLAGLILGAVHAQRANDGLGTLFAACLATERDLQPSLAKFVREIRRHGWGDTWDSDTLSRGARHILPDPSDGGGCKRLLLYLRWMVRPDDGVDLGVWKQHVSPSKLLVPIDTHLHRIAKNVGLTTRSSVTWQTAEEVTRALARLDPDDPVRFDFPLCHMGIVQRCPSRRDDKRCEGCGVKPVCVHWQRKAKSKSRVVA